MAQGWTPPRSRLYSAPLYGAVADIAAQMGDALRARSNEEIDAERIRQTANGRLALMKERNSLFTKIQKEQARTTAEWVPTLRDSWTAIEKGVLSGVTQPQAKQALQLELSEARQKWELELDNAARQQDAENLAADITAGIDGFYKESIEFTDDAHMQSYLGEGLRLLETAHNPGGLPVLDSVATPEALDFEKRRMTRHIVGNWLVQAALTADDENVLDHANDLAPRVDDREEPLFGPDELAELHKEYDAIANAAKAEVEKRRQEQATTFEADVTKRLLLGQFVISDEKGNERNLRDLIIANPDITPAVKRTLEGEYNEQTSRWGKGKTYSEQDKLEAYIEIRSETDKTKKLELLRKHAAGLGFNEVQSLYDKMNDPAADDTWLTSRIKETVTAVRTYRAKGEREPEIARAHTDLMRIENEIYRTLDAHPEWKTPEKIDYVDKALQPVKEEAAKVTIRSRIWGLIKSKPMVVGSLEATRAYSAKQGKAIPAGLEAVWADLSEQERQEAQVLLQRGVTAQRILEEFQR